MWKRLNSNQMCEQCSYKEVFSYKEVSYREVLLYIYIVFVRVLLLSIHHNISIVCPIHSSMIHMRSSGVVRPQPPSICTHVVYRELYIIYKLCIFIIINRRYRRVRALRNS